MIVAEVESDLFYYMRNVRLEGAFVDIVSVGPLKFAATAVGAQIAATPVGAEFTATAAGAKVEVT